MTRWSAVLALVLLGRVAGVVAAIDGVTATQPQPDLIEVQFHDRALPPQIAKILAGREDREVIVSGDDARAVFDELIALGIPESSLRSTGDETEGVVLSVTYQ